MTIKVLATGSKGNCYHISDGVTRLLIECGIKYTEIIKRCNYDVEGISTVLISHAHADHALIAKQMAEYGFDLVMPKGTAVTLGLDALPNVFTPPAGKTLLIGTFAVVPFELVHINSDGSECPCYGYLVCSRNTREKLLFATDTAYIKNQFRGLTHILLEVNYTSNMLDDDFVPEVERRRIKSHMSLDTAAQFLKSTDTSQLKALYAIHASEARCDKDLVYETLEPFAKEVIIA